MNTRNMKNYLSGMHKPKEMLEKIYLNLFSIQTDTETTFGVTHDVLYETNKIQFGAIIDTEGLSGIAKRVHDAFRKEGFCEDETMRKDHAEQIRLGMQKENDHYVALVSLSPYNPQLPFFNHTVDIRKMSS